MANWVSVAAGATTVAIDNLAALMRAFPIGENAWLDTSREATPKVANIVMEGGNLAG